MLLTRNFTLEEMLKSATAARHGLLEAQMNPPIEVVNNLRTLCINILQPLRDAIERPIFVTSGYRSPQLNEIVNGAPNSQHMSGQASDIEAVGSMSNRELFEIIRDLDLPFDQLIWEHGTSRNPDWVHVSFSNQHRKQIFSIPSDLLNL
jgi:zinc D-Ala-D-Ala carboxypeptidase